MSSSTKILPGLRTSEVGGKIDQGIKLSLILHGSLIGVLLFKGIVFPDKTEPYIPALRVDLVALPDILKKDLANIPAKKDIPIKPEASVKPKEEVIFKSKPKTNDGDLQLGDKTKRSEKIKNALQRIKALQEVQEQDVIVKGNQISKGTELSGDAKEKLQATYLDLVYERIKANWALPIWLSRKDLSAKVRISIDAYGRVLQYQFEKGSGHPQFDSAVKQALAKSDPFPPPPEDLRKAMERNGILLGFPL
jgi:TonB family protein